MIQTTYIKRSAKSSLYSLPLSISVYSFYYIITNLLSKLLNEFQHYKKYNDHN